MQTINHSILIAIALLLAVPAVAEDSPRSIPSLLDCTKRDAQFIAQLEYYGETDSVAGEKLYAAFMTMLRARCACSAGRTSEGIALYDSVFGSTIAHR